LKLFHRVWSPRDSSRLTMDSRPQLVIAQEELPETARAPETPESLARRNDPSKKDARHGCQAFALAFPGGVTGDDKRRGGAG